MYTPSLREEGRKAIGFTLLELLIVIGIMVILGSVLILVLNPAETLKKARDNQRISDLATLKTALGLYVTDVASPDLDASISNHCLGGVNLAALISYSKLATDVSCAVNIAEGADVDTTTATGFGTTATDSCRYVATSNTLVDGTGWVPVDLTSITGGSPLSGYPLDPVNTVASNSAPLSTDLVYRYACANAQTLATKPDYVFEFNAQLESTAYTGTVDKRATDGGDNDNYYEVGSSVKLIGTGTNF